MTNETGSLPHASRLLDALNRGELEAQELRMRPRDCAVLRVMQDARPLILKVWARSGWSARARQLTGTSPLQRELHALEQLGAAGVRVPKVWSHHLDERGTPWTQALAMEDFGPCALALDHVKALMNEGARDQLDALLEGIVEMTRRMVSARVLDADHGFVNILVREPGETIRGVVFSRSDIPTTRAPENYAQPVRIDLELARSVSRVSLHPLLYGQMLARLMGSFIFAVQPATEHAEAFAARVLGALRPPPLALKYATHQVAGMLRKQRLTTGIDTRVRLPW